MDQVRTILNWLKQQHFWVLSGVVALIGLFCWWSASRVMSAKYSTNQQTITSQFNSIAQLRSTPFHPNQAINERQDAERKKQLESVTKLWQRLYDRQKAEVLQWPPQLRQDFADAVEKLQFNDDIPAHLRNRYRDYIDRHFPELPKQINARIIEDTTAGGGEFGRGGGFGREGEGGPGFVPGMVPEDNDYITEWLDQTYVREELNFPEQPSSLRIWVTQEDLWVYHTLLDVIAKTNQAANATRMSNAAVKVVYSLEVGQRAAPYSRQPNRLAIQPPAAAAVPGESFGEGGPAGAEMGRGVGAPPRGSFGEGGGFGGMGGGAMSPAAEQAFLMSGRYLDEKGMPILVGGGAIGEALEGPPTPDAAADLNAAAPELEMAQFGVGYKRLPIRMAMQMDIRWLPHLIAACANEPLRVEVEEVRINPPDMEGMDAGSAGGGSRFGGFGGGGERGFGGGERGFGGGGRTSGANLFPDLSGIQTFPSQPHVANVVILGTIYIFNKPDMNLLEQASAEQSDAPPL